MAKGSEMVEHLSQVDNADAVKSFASKLHEVAPNYLPEAIAWLKEHIAPSGDTVGSLNFNPKPTPRTHSIHFTIFPVAYP